MKLTKEVSDIFNLGKESFNIGDPIAEKYKNMHEVWKDFSLEFGKLNNKLTVPEIMSWQNSGHLKKYFWSSYKFEPLSTYASFVGIYVDGNKFSIDIGYKITNQSGNYSLNQYNNDFQECIFNWARNITSDDFVINKAYSDNIESIKIKDYVINPKLLDKLLPLEENAYLRVSFVIQRKDFEKVDTKNSVLIKVLNELCDLYQVLQPKNIIFSKLLNAKEILPYEYDGSYEIVNEVVECYKTLSKEKVTIDDMNALFFMSVGTFSQGIDKKIELINQSNLSKEQKLKIVQLLHKNKKKAENDEYGHKNNGHMGMFGVGFHTFKKGNTTNKSAQRFIEIAISMSQVDENKAFDLLKTFLKEPIEGVQMATLSTFLHCLRPTIFPIINGNQGKGVDVYTQLGINLIGTKTLQDYVNNCIGIKEFRDKYFKFKNYRIFDIMELSKVEEYSEKEIINEDKSYWVGGATYDNVDLMQYFIDNSLFGIGFMEDDLKNVITDNNKLQQVFTQHNIDDTTKNVFKSFFSIKRGDIIALKSTYATKAGDSILRVKAIGTVAADIIKGYRYDKTAKHTIPVRWEKFDQFNLSGLGSYRRTLHKIEKEEDIKAIFFRDNEISNKNENLTEKAYTKEKFLEDVFVLESEYETLRRRLEKKKCIIIQGAPGVGKSFMAEKLAYSILGWKDSSKLAMIQFHQSYSYEDFIEGFRPTKEGAFVLKKGIFYNFCKNAEKDENNNYYFIIDEINRGNLSKIFGELMLLIEEDKRGKEFEIPLLYSSDEKFSIPNNVYIIGLMNTADRSLALIDHALRRRFGFIEIGPAFDKDKFIKYQDSLSNEKFDKLIKVIKDINKDICNIFGDGYQIGHSYFCNLKSCEDNALKDIVECEIVPLLSEYWFDDKEKVKKLKDSLYEAIS